MTKLQSSFGYWLRRRRKALDLTQAQLATRAGCALTTIKKLETGTRQPSRQLAARLADVARCQGDYARTAELYSESLALYHQLGNRAEIPAILHNQCGPWHG